VVFIHLFYPKGDRINSMHDSTFGDTNGLRLDNGLDLGSPVAFASPSLW
jgi:hypothetical protein